MSIIMNMFQKLLTCLFDIMPNKIEYITAQENCQNLNYKLNWPLKKTLFLDKKCEIYYTNAFYFNCHCGPHPASTS
jgi:hypothetical protein